MATEPREMEDIARIAGALLVNIGTMRTENLQGMILAGMHLDHTTRIYSLIILLFLYRYVC